MCLLLLFELYLLFVTSFKAPFVYRIHEKPTPEKMKSLLEFVEAFNVKTSINPKDVKPDDLNKIVANDGDVYINLDTGEVFEYSTEWVSKGNFQCTGGGNTDEENFV